MNFFNYLNVSGVSRPVPESSGAFQGSFHPRTNPGTNILQSVYSKSNDELWIETWLQQNNVYQAIPKLKKMDTGQKLSIHDAKTSLRDCLILLQKLDKVKQELADNVETMSSMIWKQKTIEIGTLKDEFTKLMSKFENVEVLKRLKLTINKRKKKRLNIKKRKQFRQAQSIEKRELCKKLHKDIDQWLTSMKEEAAKNKMEENMKKDADCVLSEVTKKKSDARKQLSLICALVKLRSVREHVALQRGEKTSLEDRQAFNITTEKLVKMWESSLKTYGIEEQGLRLMLEKTANEDSRAARVAKERKLVEAWQYVFFGPNIIPMDNPTYWALTAAERDMETFIAIRKSWDTFLVPPSHDMGSKIPIGWVLPDSNPSEAWCKYLDNN